MHSHPCKWGQPNVITCELVAQAQSRCLCRIFGEIEFLNRLPANVLAILLWKCAASVLVCTQYLCTATLPSRYDSLSEQKSCWSNFLMFSVDEGHHKRNRHQHSSDKGWHFYVELLHVCQSDTSGRSACSALLHHSLLTQLRFCTTPELSPLPTPMGISAHLWEYVEKDLYDIKIHLPLSLRYPTVYLYSP